MPRATVRMARPQLSSLVVPTPQEAPAVTSRALALRTTDELANFGNSEFPPRSVLPDLTDPRLVLVHDPDSARATAFRVLRDNLVAKGLPRVVAVSSGERGDGKTICAVNLALALTEHGATRRVLLLDGNLSAPALAEIFEVGAHPPSSVFVDFDAFQPYEVIGVSPRLHVCAPATHPGEPLPKFDTRLVGALIARLCRAGYDNIIVDAPAIEVGSSLTVRQLLDCVDGVVLVVRAGRTTGRSLRRAAGNIPKGKALGFTLVEA